MAVAAAPCPSLKEYVEWCRKTSPKTWYFLGYTLSEVDNKGIVSYSEGWLSWNGARGVLEGNMSGDPWYASDSKDAQGQPFNRPTTRKMIVNLNTGQCTAICTVPGGVPLTIPLQSGNGLLRGSLPAKGREYLITLRKLEVDAPRPL
jgi:hypothetical protein